MYSKNDLKKIILLIIIGVVAYLMISNFNFLLSMIGKIGDAIFPFVLGIILAFVLNILMVKIEKVLNKIKKKWKITFPVRGTSIALSLIIFFIIIIFIILEVVPEFVNNIEVLIKNIPIMFDSIENYCLNILSDYPDIQVKITELFNDTANINNILINILNYIVNGAVDFITSFVNSIITFFTSLVFAIYMLSQKEYLINGMKKVIRAYTSEIRAKKIIDMGKLINSTFSKFVSGQCLEAVILGCIFFIVLTVFRFPYALLISILTTITALIPIFGAIIAIIIGAILIATVNPFKALIFIIVFLIIQQIEGNLIYPKVVGKSVGLAPIWTLFAVSVGGGLFGISGMLIGLPLASIIYALIRKDVNSKLKEK